MQSRNYTKKSATFHGTKTNPPPAAMQCLRGALMPPNQRSSDLAIMTSQEVVPVPTTVTNDG